MEVEVTYDKFLEKWVVAHYNTEGLQISPTEYAEKRAIAVSKARKIMNSTEAKVKIYTKNGKLTHEMRKRAGRRPNNVQTE